MKSIKENAIEYRELTGRPLGVTGEIAELEAVNILNLKLAEVRQSGYDAKRKNGQKIQIKGRCILKKSNNGQRLGTIKIDKEWDSVVLVLLNGKYEPIEILEAPRKKIIKEIQKPGSKARNERGALSINNFRAISNKIWPNKENS